MILKFLEKCAQVEHIVSEIYLEFASNDLNDSTLATIWKDMARDEEDHCQQLRLASRMPLFESFEGIKDHSPDPDDLYKQAGEILEDAKQRQFTVLEMLQSAVILEKEFRKLHAPYALVFKDESLRNTFDLLARGDREHLQALDAYLKKYKAENMPG